MSGLYTNSFTIQDSISLFPDDMALVDVPMQNAELNPSAEWQMWRLFNIQVPIAWLNRKVDLFDL